MKRNQAADAQYLYDNRSDRYDESHHPRFARHMVELVGPQPGEQVLDLACGTGLVSYAASTAVGSSGSVIGVDISSGMLAQAERKKAQHPLRNIVFYQHSITELDTLKAVNGKQFDIITCCSALVLLEHPTDALKHWVTFLKPRGRLIVDVTHPQNLTPGVLFEKVGKVLQRPLPWYRLAFQKPDDLREMMQTASLFDVDIMFMSQLGDESDKLEDFIRPSFSDPKVHREYEITDSDHVFDNMIDGPALRSLASPSNIREKARVVFKEEWWVHLCGKCPYFRDDKLPFLYGTDQNDTIEASIRAKVANAEGKVQEIDGIFMVSSDEKKHVLAMGYNGYFALPRRLAFDADKNQGIGRKP